jgi:outer membrane protein assembly factor BamC
MSTLLHRFVGLRLQGLRGPAPHDRSRGRALAALAGVGALLAACGSMPKMDEVIRDRQVEYKSAQTLPPLEVPPDLSRSSIEERLVVPDAAPPGGSATLSEYARERGGAEEVAKAGVLPGIEGMRVMRDGDTRWLVVAGEPSRYWDRVRAFWLENGLTLKVENPSAGVMETDWAENRADIPHSFLRSLIGKMVDSVYSTATRDRFRTRFERGAGNTTEIYISHRGAEEVAQGDTTVWQPRASDPELEAEMLNRLIVYLGVKQEQADRMMAATGTRAPQARLERDATGAVALRLDNDFSRAWRRTGLALDRVGFTVEDRDRSRGLYYVRYVDPLAGGKDTGLLSKLKFWGEGEKPAKIEYLVSLSEQGAGTRVVVLDRQGTRDNSDTAGRILALLEQELK